MTTTNKTIRTRDAAGRYDLDKLERMCRCGARLGDHLAAKPRACEATGCAGFRAFRANGVRAGSATPWACPQCGGAGRAKHADGVWRCEHCHTVAP